MDMKKPLISVIIAVYNGANTIEETICSVLAQTYSNLQVIIIDDASTDSSRDIIDKFEDNRIERVYLSRNRNVCYAVREGFKKIKGEYLAVIGHDDIWLPEKLEKQMEYLSADEDVVACFTRVEMIDENGCKTTQVSGNLSALFERPNFERFEMIREMIINGNYLCGATPLIRMSAIEKVGGYKMGYVQLQDYELWLRLLLIGKIHILDEKLTLYRRNSDGVTNLSSFTQENINRDMHERSLIIYKYIVEMNDELFSNVFGFAFTNKGCCPEEVICEKALLLYKLNNPFAYEYMIDILEDNSLYEILENKYGFSVQEFYKLNGQAILLDSAYVNIVKMQDEIIAKLQDIVEKR